MFLNSLLSKQFTGFVIVGSAGVLTNIFIFWIAADLLSVNIYFASSIAFIFSAFQNYTVNNKYVFKSERIDPKAGISRSLVFLLGAVLGLLFSLIMLYFLSFFSSLYYMNQLVAIILTSLFNYNFSKYFVFI